MSSEYYTPIFVLVGVLGSAYLTYLGTTYKFRTKPKDPANELFNYYEMMLKSLWQQNAQKDKIINSLEAKLEKIQQELQDTQDLLREYKEQLAAAAKQGQAVQQHITDARSALNQEVKL